MNLLKKNKENMKILKTIKGRRLGKAWRNAVEELDILAELAVERPAEERKIRESLPTARELSFRIDELEYRVKELEGFVAPDSSVDCGGEVMTAEEYMRREKAVADLLSQSTDADPAEKEVDSFRWITDRPPTREDADKDEKVACYYKLVTKKWDSDHWDEACIRLPIRPWAPLEQVQQFTDDNPAPSPYDQEVSG